MVQFINHKLVDCGYDSNWRPWCCWVEVLATEPPLCFYIFNYLLTLICSSSSVFNSIYFLNLLTYLLIYHLNVYLLIGCILAVKSLLNPLYIGHWHWPLNCSKKPGKNSNPFLYYLKKHFCWCKIGVQQVQQKNKIYISQDLVRVCCQELSHWKLWPLHFWSELVYLVFYNLLWSILLLHKYVWFSF